jgi:inosine-uridine nucleoside N-ribohydrolase
MPGTVGHFREEFDPPRDQVRGSDHDEALPAAPVPVFVDTDIGDDIDDALALALLLCSPEVKLIGISTVFGDTRLRARLAAYLLQIYERADVPVAAGEPMPLLLRHDPSGVCQASVLTDEMVLPLSPLSGPELLIQAAHAYPGQLRLLCLGPLTNIARALEREPHLGVLLHQVYFMGGASRVFWPDWNVRSDMHAAQRVLGASLPLTMVGWNVTAACHCASATWKSFAERRARGCRPLCA